MAVLKSEEMEEVRTESAASAIISDKPEQDFVAGVKLVRRVSPLVLVALEKANNPFITGKAGFEAAGIAFDPKALASEAEDRTDEQKAVAARFAMAIMPKTAEVLACFSCTREELRKFARDPVALEDASFDILENVTSSQDMVEAMLLVTKEMSLFQKVRVSPAPEEQTPESATTGKKKLDHTG